MMIMDFNSKKVIKILLFLGMLFQLSSCKTETCDDNCRLLQNTVLFASIGGFNNLEQCPYDYNLSPGDSVEMTITAPYTTTSVKIIGCSTSLWNLTVTPPVDGAASIYKISRPNCASYSGVLLDRSPVAGSIASFSGTEGCMTTGVDVIEVSGTSPSGSSFLISFN